MLCDVQFDSDSIELIDTDGAEEYESQDTFS